MDVSAVVTVEWGLDFGIFPYFAEQRLENLRSLLQLILSRAVLEPRKATRSPALFNQTGLSSPIKLTGQHLLFFRPFHSVASLNMFYCSS